MADEDFTERRRATGPVMSSDVAAVRFRGSGFFERTSHLPRAMAAAGQ
jgi:hypothetical protein